MRIVIVGGYAPSLLNFRGPFLRALRNRGHEVVAAAPSDHNREYVQEALAAIGVAFSPVPLSRGGLSPLSDLRGLRTIKTLLRDSACDVLLAYTAKAVIYGGLAARKVGPVRFFPMITGAGYAFTDGYGLKRRWIRAVVERLYRSSLSCAETVIFQNPDDERLFRGRRLVSTSAPTALVNGSGVDLKVFSPVPLPGQPVFLMLARLVADKGVREYMEAACIVRERFPQAIFRLAGGLDPNPAGIQQEELQTWIDSKAIEYLGQVRPVQDTLAQCRFYVLPSYREGTPRSVLEAMATGRPIITTDAPGCRETVEHGVNGLLVPPRDAESLAKAMIEMIERPDSEIQAMADASLEIARARYDVNLVNRQMLEIMGL